MSRRSQNDDNCTKKSREHKNGEDRLAENFQKGNLKVLDGPRNCCQLTFVGLSYIMCNVFAINARGMRLFASWLFP